jgi:urease accessory protein
MFTSSAMLLLADGRFPAGGHAHSSGLEAAVVAGRVTDVPTLERFLRGRLATAGLVAAAFAAAAHQAAAHQAAGLGDVAASPAAADQAPADRGSPFGVAALLAELDRELDARTASPALRLASRRQGRALIRAARATWPSEVYRQLPARADGVHQPIVLGVTAAAAALSTHDSALLAAYGVLTGPASAAVRLLGLDPYHNQALLARLAGSCDTVATTAVAAAGKPASELPACAAPLADISAEIHATWEVRLFAS